MVRIDRADRARRDGEIALGRVHQKRQLGRARLVGRVRQPLQSEQFVKVFRLRAERRVEGRDISAETRGHQGCQRALGRVRRIFFHHGVKESGVRRATPPPRQLVVDEIAEQPGIVAVRLAAGPRHIPAIGLEVRMKDVRKGRARPPFVRCDLVLVAQCRQIRADVEKLGVHQPAMLEPRRAARPQHVEAPLFQAAQRFALPLGLIGIFLPVFLAIGRVAQLLAPMAMIGHVIHAQQHQAAPQRIDRPPASIRLLDDAEKAGRLIPHVRHAVRHIKRRHRRLRRGLFRRGLRPRRSHGAVNAHDTGHAQRGPSDAHRSRRKGKAPAQDQPAVRRENRAGDALRIHAERQSVRLSEGPWQRRRFIDLHLQVVLHRPLAVAHLAQLHHRPATLLRRHLHQCQLPVVVGIRHDRHPSDSPAVAPRLLRREERLDRDGGGERCRLIHGDAVPVGGNTLDLLRPEAPRQRIAEPSVAAGRQCRQLRAHSRHGHRQQNHTHPESPIHLVLPLDC